MKTTWLLLLNGLLAAPAWAQAPANANFATDRRQVFTLVLDGRPVTQANVPQLHLEQLAPGEHVAEFAIPSQRNNTTRLRTKIWLEPGQETSFVLAIKSGALPVLRKAGAVALVVPETQRLGYGTIQANPSAYGAPGSYAGQYGGNPLSNTGNYAGAGVNGYPVMGPQDVDALLEAVSKRSFEATKLSTAKEALSQTSIRADDLKRLLRTMSFEASRVELAKFAYLHVADRQNFYRVYEAFDFDASVRDVQQTVGTAAK